MKMLLPRWTARRCFTSSSALVRSAGVEGSPRWQNADITCQCLQCRFCFRVLYFRGHIVPLLCAHTKVPPFFFLTVLRILGLVLLQHVDDSVVCHHCCIFAFYVPLPLSSLHLELKCTQHISCAVLAFWVCYFYPRVLQLCWELLSLSCG